jgi:cytochrome c oxidase subunit 2
MWLTKGVAAIAAAWAVFVAATTALAQGRPEPWQIGFQDAASPVMERIDSFFDLLLVIIALITVFVLSLMAYVMVRFNARRNPVPSKTSHNTLIEVLWTVVPIMILVIIAVPSFKLLYFQKVIPEAEMTIKAVGSQFYWTYEYPDHDGLTFDAVLKDRDALEGDEPWLLETDNRVVVPVATNIRLLITASDVIHAWAVPALGVKMDAVPGRLNESWMRIDREGIYYGQCSEFCGTNHGFMPIAVEAVSKEAFAAWLEKAKEEFARADADAARVAQAGS